MRVIDRHKLDARLISVAMNAKLRLSRSSLAMTSLAFCRRQASSALANCGRSDRLPLSTSVNSATSDHRPPSRKSRTDLRCASRPRPDFPADRC